MILRQKRKLLKKNQKKKIKIIQIIMNNLIIILYINKAILKFNKINQYKKMMYIK